MNYVLTRHYAKHCSASHTYHLKEGVSGQAHDEGFTLTKIEGKAEKDTGQWGKDTEGAHRTCEDRAARRPRGSHAPQRLSPKKRQSLARSRQPRQLVRKRHSRFSRPGWAHGGTDVGDTARAQLSTIQECYPQQVR